MATEKQLRDRWLTPEGKKIKKNIIENLSDYNWERYLKNLPFVSEVKNCKDLRYINFTFENYYTVGMKNLKNGELLGPNFTKADLTGADLTGASLGFSNFSGAILNNVKLVTSNLAKSDLSKSIIKKSDLMGSTLWGCDLSSSIIINSNLFACNLTNSILLDTKIINCDIYGISAWNLKINENTMMKDLIIREDQYKKPLITVDDIEIAQFINLILNNDKIFNVITLMRTKGVLILGSFYDDKERKITPKKVLDKIKEILPKYNLIPIVFDFSNPEKQDLVSTVRTLALLSSFIIVDLSMPAGQLFELGALVQTTPIPFIPIASTGTKHITSMIQEKGLGNYHWFRKNYIRYSLKEYNKQIPELISKKIIPWAKEKNFELEEQRVINKKNKNY